MEPRRMYSDQQVREWAFFELRSLGLVKDNERYMLTRVIIRERLKGHPDEKRICHKIEDLMRTWEDDYEDPTPQQHRSPRFNTETDEWEDGDESDLGIDWKMVDALDDL